MSSYITGAGSGIGKATAHTFAREGASVAVTDIDAASAEAVAAAIRAEGGDAIALRVDVSDEQQVRTSIATTIEEFGSVDIAFLNAAADSDLDQGVLTTPDKVWDSCFRVNLMSVVYGARHLIPPMIERGGGTIVVTSSLAGEVGDIQRTAYGSLKGAVTSLVRYIATQHGRDGININAILPSLVMSEGVVSQFPEPLKKAVIRHQVTDRVTTPEDVAALALFLASDQSVAIRGQAIRIDAGQTVMGASSPDILEAMTAMRS